MPRSKPSRRQQQVPFTATILGDIEGKSKDVLDVCAVGLGLGRTVFRSGTDEPMVREFFRVIENSMRDAKRLAPEKRLLLLSNFDEGGLQADCEGEAEEKDPAALLVKLTALTKETPKHRTEIEFVHVLDHDNDAGKEKVVTATFVQKRAQKLSFGP